MARFYHGSLSRYVIDGASFHIKQVLKKSKNRAAGSKLPAEISRRLETYDRLAADRDWVNLRHQALALAQYAEQRKDADLMREMARALERLGDYGRAADLGLVCNRLTHGVDPKEWDGSDISDKHLLVWLAGPDMGTTIRDSLAVPHAARKTARTTVVTVPRLVPLFDRSFDGVEVIAADAPRDNGQFHRTAQQWHLAAYFLRDPVAMGKDVAPLVADGSLVDAFREKYRRSGDGPLIGISWGSRSHPKDVPGFADWRYFLRAMPATYVSLQYGKIAPALRRLRRGVPHPIIYDETVDQLKGMDRFAAQVAAMDAVVSIGNTCAHLTGALGVPAVLMRGHEFVYPWPVMGERVPWYPHARLVTRDGRTWREVFDDVRRKLQSLLPEHV